MFPPNGTKLDEYEYHDREAEYHLRAGEALNAEVTRRIERARETRLDRSLVASGTWSYMIRVAHRMIKLQRQHTLMIEFHVRRMEAIRESGM